MINNNNNFSDINSMSASVYYGDGSNLTDVGGGTSSATIFNSISVPVPGALPWYKLNLPTTSSSTSNFILSLDQTNFNVTSLVKGETINEVAIFCSIAVASTTASIALYSTSLDVNGFYPSTLLTTFGDVSLATTGRKTITGLSYSIPASPYGIYYTAILRTGGTIVSSPSILSIINAVNPYGSINNASNTRPMTTQASIGSSFLSTITSASFSSYTNSTVPLMVGFR
jgi:hypothetical protein